MIPLGIADSSTIISLGRINRLELLSKQFGRLYVPQVVAEEVGDLPPWISVKQVTTPRLLDVFPPSIHRGEAQVIMLGVDLPDSVLVLDDWHARSFANKLNLPVIGTIGLLLRAKRYNHIDAVSPVLDELVKAGFRISDELIIEALRLSGERY